MYSTSEASAGENEEHSVSEGRFGGSGVGLGMSFTGASLHNASVFPLLPLGTKLSS